MRQITRGLPKRTIAADTGDDAEEWRPVVGWELVYEISSHGRVRSLTRVSNRRLLNGRVLKPQSNPKRGRYLHVRLCEDSRKRTAKIHVMVAEAFLGARPAGYDIRHLDGDPTNNHVANLQYGTRSDNVRDAVQHGTHNHVAAKVCPRGHPYNESNTYLDRKGRRYCRACARKAGRETYARNREAILARRAARKALTADTV